MPGEAGRLGDGDDRDVRRFRVRPTGRVRGVGVDGVAVVERKGIGEVAVVDRLAVEQPTEDRQLDALGLGRVGADRALGRTMTGVISG